MPLHVLESGPEDASAIVFLHGGGGAGWMWRPQVERFSAAYRVIAPDLPEQGQSTDAGPFTMESAAEQIAALIAERAAGGRAHVVGLSEGAQVLVQLLATRPETVASAFVSSALVRPLPGMKMAGSPGVLRWTYRTTMAPLRGSDWWIRLNMRSAAGVPDQYFDDFRESFRTLCEDGFVDLMVANQTFRLPSGLERVQAPTLVVVGAREYDAMKDSARDIAGAVRGARAYEVVHPGKMSLAQEHNWNMSAPELFNETLAAWLAGGALPSELRPLQVDARGARRGE